MAEKILAITNAIPTSGKIYYGGESGPASLIEVHTDNEVMTRCHINPHAPAKLAVAGPGNLWYSVDSGATWNVTTFVVGVGVKLRTLQWVNSTTLYIATTTNIYISTDNGATLLGVPLSFNGDDIMDLHFFPGQDQVGYVVQNNLGPAGGGFLYYTINGGAAWEEYTLPAQGQWHPFESPRRVVVTRYNGIALNEVFILTSHKVWRYQHPPAAIGIIPIVTVPWNYEPVVIGLFPSYDPTGYDPYGTDNNTRFDDMVILGTRVWLGGYNTLRGHSFDQIAWFITELSTSAASTDFFTHAAINFSRVFAGSSQSSFLTLPFRPGLNESNNGGVSITPYLLFPIDESLAHQSAFEAADGIGCSDPDSCTYSGTDTDPVELDDGSCMYAVQLRSCTTNQLIHVDNPAVVEVACRGPRIAIEIQAIDPDASTQSLQLFVNGVLAFTYNTAIPTTDLPLDRITEFIQGLVAHINQNTPGRAFRIPASQNPITPGGEFAIWAEGTPFQSGQPASIIPTGLVNATTQSFFDTGTSGQVVSLLQYPGECWVACGAGTCALVESVDLVSVFSDCVSCQIIPVGRICMDCSTQVFNGGVALKPNGSPSDVNCLAAGDELVVSLRVSFPDRQQETFAVIEGGECGNCPVTLTIQGDKRLYFPIGSQFTSGPQLGFYTVASVFYDAGADTTTIVTVENCTGSETIEEVIPFLNCICNVRVWLERFVNNAWVTVSDVTTPCTEHQVNGDFVMPVSESGLHRLRIIATDCAETRTCIYWLSICDAFSAIEVGCHHFEIRSANFFSGNRQVTIQDVATGEILVNEQLPHSAFPFQFINDHDSVYLVTSGTILEVIDICDLLTCRRDLMQKVFCAEDPCTDLEDSDTRLRREELSRIALVMSQIDADVFTHRYRFSGIPVYSNDRTISLQRIAQDVRVAGKLSERCAECTSSLQPCKDC